jgi:glycosyltransferase involved in cell wall biosynthesis
MKILMVINCLCKGGRERRLLELIRELKQKDQGYEIYLVALNDRIDYPVVYELPIQFKIITKKDKKDFSLVFKLRRIIKEFNPDILHSWDVMSSAYLTAANLFINKTLVNGVIYNAAQNSDWYERDYFKVKLFTAISDITVANSKAGIKAFKASSKKTICIYNGINLKRFENLKPVREVELDVLKKEKGDHYIGTMVAAFENRKDYDTLLAAAIRICRSNNKMIFLLIGQGTNRDRLMQLVPSEMLNNQIYFLGVRDDIESILQITDVGLLITAPCEGLSNSIIEYMAAGKPVIATEGGGTDELVQDGVTGFLIKNQNSEEIINRLEILMRDPHLAATLGETGSKWVRDNLDVRKMTDAYIRMYSNLMNKKKRRSTTKLELPAMKKATA